MIEIAPNFNNKFQFTIKAKSGDILLSSVDFSNESAMNDTIKKLKTLPLFQNQFERRTSTDGKFHFSLQDSDGTAIGHSEAYDSEAGMENGIQNLETAIKS